MCLIIIFIMSLLLYIFHRPTKVKLIHSPYEDIAQLNAELRYVDNSDHLVLAEKCQLPAARALNRALQTHHDQIKLEIAQLFRQGYEGVYMSDLDPVQHQFLHGTRKWSCVWVKFINSYAGTAKSLPTLKRITEEIGEDIILLHVSVLWPGAKLDRHRGPSKAVWRYHYGLSIPVGDIGLIVENTLGDQKITWRERQGFVWDDTYPHEAWNNTKQPRFIIFADIRRQLPPELHQRVTEMHTKIQDTQWIKNIQERLKQEGIGLM